MARSDAERQRDRRRRDRRNLYVVRVEVSGQSLEHAVDAGWLTEADTCDPAKVANVIQVVFQGTVATAAKSVTT
jgi:hypothetical protein